MRSRVINVLVFLTIYVALDLWLIKYVGPAISEMERLDAYLRPAEVKTQHNIPGAETEAGYWSFTPNISGQYQWGEFRRHPYYTNSLGFKDRRIREVPLAADGPRLLFIGDSFTEGVNYPHEMTFVGLVDEALVGVPVLNAAVSGTGPKYYRIKLEHLLDRVGLEVSEIVVMIDISDVSNAGTYLPGDAELCSATRYQVPEHEVVALARDDPPFLARYERAKQLVAEAQGRYRWRRLLKDRSVTFAFLFTIHDWIDDNIQFMQRGAPDVRESLNVGALNWHFSLWTVHRHIRERCMIDGVAISQAEMTRIADLLSRHRIPLTVAVYPWPDQVYYGDTDSIQVRIWRDWARRHGARFIDLFTAFLSGGDPLTATGKYYLRGDVHFNHNGHRLVARHLLKHLNAAGTGFHDR